MFWRRLADTLNAKCYAHHWAICQYTAKQITCPQIMVCSMSKLNCFFSFFHVVAYLYILVCFFSGYQPGEGSPAQNEYARIESVVAYAKSCQQLPINKWMKYSVRKPIVFAFCRVVCPCLKILLLLLCTPSIVCA